MDVVRLKIIQTVKLTDLGIYNQSVNPERFYVIFVRENGTKSDMLVEATGYLLVKRTDVCC